jgi:hypothetical protein
MIHLRCAEAGDIDTILAIERMPGYEAPVGWFDWQKVHNAS